MNTTMSSRERVYRALNHEEPDRVPICLGGTSASSIEESPPDYCAASNLYAYLGLKNPQPIMLAPVCNVVANLDEQCLVRLHSDMRLLTDIPPGPVTIDAENKVWPFFYGGHIRKVGLYDQIDLTRPPMAYMTTEEEIEAYPYWPDLNADTMRGVTERAKKLHHETDYFICGAQTTGHFPLNGYSLVSGIEKWLLDMKLRPRFYHRLCEKFMEYNLAFVERFYGSVGRYLDAAMVYDDLGSQNGPLMSPADYRTFYKPYQAEIVHHIRRHLRPEAKIILKSCGSIFPFIPDFIEMGVDVLSPVQPLARNMEPWRLKKEFGKDLAFLGGLDVQRLLPFGSVEEIERGVKLLIEEYARGGGYVFGASYVIQCNTPPEKITAMFDAAHQYGEYPITERTGGTSFVDYVESLGLSPFSS